MLTRKKLGNFKRKSDSILVDCRTSAEWNFVGVPNLKALNKDVFFIEWQTYPLMAK